MWTNDDTRERFLATANDATAFAIDDMIAEADEAGDNDEVARLVAERNSLFLGHSTPRITLVRAEIKDSIATPVAKLVWSDGTRLIVSCTEARRQAGANQVPAVRVAEWSA